MSNRPDWLVPGAEVAVFRHPRMGPPHLELTTVDRVLKRDAVLTNGERFNASTCRRPGATTWDSPTYLLPLDDPKVALAQEQIRAHRALSRVRAAIAEAEECLRRQNPDVDGTVEKLITKLQGERP